MSMSMSDENPELAALLSDPELVSDWLFGKYQSFAEAALTSLVMDSDALRQEFYDDNVEAITLLKAQRESNRKYCAKALIGIGLHEQG